MQQTLFGEKAKDLLTCQKYQPPIRDKEPAQQIKVGNSKEALMQRREEEKKCAGCKQIVEKWFDQGPGMPNGEFCIGCIKKRHGVDTNPGFIDQGELIQFTSQTTGIEVRKYEDIFRVFDGMCFPNPVFPYSLNCRDPKYRCNCLGITKECGDFLIQKLRLRQVDAKDEDGETQYIEGDEDDTATRAREWIREGFNETEFFK